MSLLVPLLLALAFFWAAFLETTQREGEVNNASGAEQWVNLVSWLAIVILWFGSLTTAHTQNVFKMVLYGLWLGLLVGLVFGLGLYFPYAVSLGNLEPEQCCPGENTIPGWILSPVIYGVPIGGGVGIIAYLLRFGIRKFMDRRLPRRRSIASQG